MESAGDHTRNRRCFYFALSTKDLNGLIHLHPKCRFVIGEQGLLGYAVIPDKDLLL